MSNRIDEDKNVTLHYEMTSIIREKVGMHEQFASQIAEAIVDGLRERRGGTDLYVGSASAAARVRRNAKIKQDFNGRNRDEICRKYRISRPQFYRIIGKPR